MGGAAVLPAAADADTCTVSVTLASGQQLSFDLAIPPGTPLSDINLPVTGTVVSISESCGSSGGTTTDTPPATTSTPTDTTDAPAPTGGTGNSGTTGDTGSATTPALGLTLTDTTPTATTGTDTTAGESATTGTTATATATTDTTSTLATPLSVHLEKQSTVASAKTQTTTTSINTTPVTKLTAAGGVPSDTNPSYSFALPGAAAVGVPNFFIDSFQIPPFLLPIYQAAGIEYNVPWQVLAAINWIETDYGRNLSVSSAGAVGWMQFLPSTFKRWGVDATGSGYADPYNPTDAIFTAARYLAASGASKNLARAIYSYNHADWYVQSVLLRAQLIGGMPQSLISALSGLVEGHFPVAAAAKYADDSVVKSANKKIRGTNAAIPVDSDAAKGTNIYAKVGSPVIAVNDGKIVGLGETKALGKFIKLQDEEGNTYTYSHLASIPKLYPVPKPVTTSRKQLAQEVKGTAATSDAGTTSAATAGTTSTPGTTRTPSAPATKATKPRKITSLLSVTLDRKAAADDASQPKSTSVNDAAGAKAAAASTSAAASKSGAASKSSAGAASKAAGGSTKASGAPASTAKVRLFANPTRPKSYAAGGEQQLLSEGSAITNFQDYFSDVLHLSKDQYTLAPLTKGSIVVAGTVLGRIGAGHDGQSPHVYFQVQPASSKATYVDPKPILDGWKLLEATAVYRASGLNPFLSHGKRATIGQILLESKSQLQEEVLKDPRISIYSCGRRDVQAGSIDRRVLATMEFLAASGLDPTISGLKCGAGTNGIDAAGQTGASMDISAINNISIAGHDGQGSITDITIRRLLTLQGAMSPAEIVSGISYKGQANTLSLPDHKNRIQVSFTPQFGANRKLTKEVKSILKPNQWIQLISHISQIPEPSVPTARSAYAVKTKTQ